MSDALDYTPEQALYDASVRASKEDYDGAIIMLVRGVDTGSTDLCHFVSGLHGVQAVGLLDLLKTRFLLGILE